MKSICIGPKQHKIHYFTELLSILSVPFLWSAANACAEPHRSRLRFLVYAILIVDGGLLLQWSHLARKSS